MFRQTLLVVFSSTEENIDILKHFYKVSIDNIPDVFEEENVFSSVLHNPSPKDFLMFLHEDTLVFVLSIPDKVGYIGIVRDALSREYSIELPSSLSWNEFIECAKQTAQSPISFR
jgi:hypothetical protein